jgi:hypothetical protein
MMRSDVKQARIHIHAYSLDANISTNASQFNATVWLRAGKERQPETALHQFPFHMPKLAVVVTTWRPRDCIPRVEHLRSYDIMPQTHSQNTPQATIQRTNATVQLWQDRLHYTVRRPMTTGRLLYNTRPAAFNYSATKHT